MDDSKLRMDHSALEIIEAKNKADINICFAIRNSVFCEEQKVKKNIEFDGLDDKSRHYLARHANFPVATMRVRPLNDYQVKIERVAVIQTFRRKQIGKALMEKAITDIKIRGFKTVILHSQTHASIFYQKLGFKKEGKEFCEAGISHICMRFEM